MKKIQIETWKERVPKQEGDGVEEVDWNILKSLNILIANRDPQSIPKGLGQFRFMGRLARAFEKAEKTNILDLEETDYNELKKIIESNIPDVWGQNPNILKSIEEFVDIKSEDEKEDEK